jgi:hypothetical protein
MMIDDECETIGGMTVRGNRSTRRRPALAAHYLPQFPHDLTRSRNRAAAVESQRLTTLDMTWAYMKVSLTS